MPQGCQRFARRTLEENALGVHHLRMQRLVTLSDARVPVSAVSRHCQSKDSHGTDKEIVVAYAGCRKDLNLPASAVHD